MDNLINEKIKSISEMEKIFLHIPVMVKEVRESLALKPGAVVVDCTLGLGGHASLLLKDIGPEGRYIGIDRDSESLKLAAANLKEFSAQCEFVHDDYRNLDKILENLAVEHVDAILLDLGISSFQLERPERGFSFKLEGPLDMRMDQDSYISAYDLVNSLSEREIASILREFGEERWHNRIAHYLVEQRTKAPIASTKDLRDMILKAVPGYSRYDKIDPATRTFQAIRIAVNRELEALEIILNKMMRLLKVGGCIAVISFHSLEDRIVKHKFRELVNSGRMELNFKKALIPSEEEVAHNPRARSAKLRVARRIE